MYASALDFAGLYTFPNPLAKVPVGAALLADNLTANKDGVGEIRRGLSAVGSALNLSGSQDFITQWFAYQNRLLLHDTRGHLWYDSTGSLAWTNFGIDIKPPIGATKIRGIEANKNFFLATSDGVYKLPTYNTVPALAGVPGGLDGIGVLAGDGTGFLGSNKQCAYQIVFGYNDVNGNLNLGNPSQRILVVNSTGGSDDVTLTFTVPRGLTTNYFYQIYRTPQTTYSAVPASNVPPGAELQLAAQQNLTGGQIAALSVSYTDVTTDALLGAALYTNPSQQGSLQTNDIPPLCVDMCVFSQMMFYANTATPFQIFTNLISVGAPNGIQIDDTFQININNLGLDFLVYTAGGNWPLSTGGTVAENIDNTARNLVAAINQDVSNIWVYAYYVSGFNSLPGQIFIQSRILNRNEPAFSIISSRGGAFSPDLTAQNYSTSDVTPNGIYVSKVGQPEAVPLVNLIFVGGGDQPIFRVLPLRDRVIVLKSDGIFVITGSTPATLSITLLDSTVTCISSESARLLNNSIYCMTNQGVVSITESGVTIQSRAIEQDLIQLTSPLYINFKDCCHGISYESERLYIMAMPTNYIDTYGTQVFCYNWVTNAWTHWPIDCASGIVNPFDNNLYMGRPIANNEPFFAANNFAYKERKNYLYTDFMDDQLSVNITGVDTTGTIITLDTTPATTWIGYGLDQTNTGIAIITAVNIGAKQVTVSLQNSTQPNVKLAWSNGPATIDIPIPIGFVGAPITAGFPHYLKDFSRVNFWFNGGNFQLITAGFITDIQGPTQYLQAIPTGGYGFGPFGATPYGGASNYPQAIQTLVPTDVAKARWLQPVLQLAFPQARFSYLGTTASYEIVSDVSG